MSPSSTVGKGGGGVEYGLGFRSHRVKAQGWNTTDAKCGFSMRFRVLASASLFY